MIPEVPPLLHERLEAQYGAELAREIEAGYVRKRTTFRVNPLKGDREAVLREIADAGIATEPIAWYDDAFLLPDGNEEQLRPLPCYDAGAIYLQSLSSMLPALVLAPKAGETVLDMAAAPGGKTTQMAAGIMARLGFMKSFPKALITACEKNAIRADRLQFNLTRQGARAVNIMRQDARLLDSLFKFDKILLDAPCSGSGTLLLEDGEPQRRMTADWLAKTAKTQKVLLQKALSLLPKKHEMVYSTCSVLQMENEDIVQSAVGMGICEVVPIEHPFLTDVPLLPTKVAGVVCVKPDERFEGFFVAKLRRK